MVHRAGIWASRLAPHTRVSARHTLCSLVAVRRTVLIRLCARALLRSRLRPLRRTPAAGDRPVRLAAHFRARLGLPTARSAHLSARIRVTARARALRSAAVCLRLRGSATPPPLRHGQRHGDSPGGRDRGRHGALFRQHAQRGPERQRQQQQQQQRQQQHAGASPWRTRRSWHRGRGSGRRPAAAAGAPPAGRISWTWARCATSCPAVTGGAAHRPAAAAGGGAPGGAPTVAGREPRPAAAATGAGPCPAQGQWACAGGRRGCADIDDIISTEGASCSSRGGRGGRVPLDVVDQPPRRDGPQVCARAALHLRGEHPQGAAESLPRRPAMGPQRGRFDRYAAGALLLDAGHVRGRLAACGAVQGQGQLRDQPPPAAAEPPAPHVHSGGVGCGPSRGSCLDGHGSALVCGPAGGVPPPDEWGLAGCRRLGRTCWRLLCDGLRRCGRIAGAWGSTE